MKLTIEELKLRIVDNYDPDVVLELLDLSTEQLLDRFEDILEQRKNKFKDLFEEGLDYDY